jgi:hypothetical protein
MEKSILILKCKNSVLSRKNVRIEAKKNPLPNIGKGLGTNPSESL